MHQIGEGYITIAQWIANALTDDTKVDSCTSLLLVQCVGDQERELQNTVFGAKAWTADSLAEMMEGIAKGFCQDFPGLHIFQLKAFYGGRTNPEALHPFQIHSKGKAGMSLFSDEASDKGMTRQKMGQENDLHRAYMGGMQILQENSLKLITMQGIMLERSYNREAQLVNENREAFDIVKDVLSKQAMSQHDNKMKEMAFQRSSEFRKKLMTVMPALVNQIFGKEIFPQSTSDTALVETIADSIKTEDVGKLMEIIPPELSGILFARLHAHTKKKNDEAEEAARAFSEDNLKKSEADAAGGN